MLAPFQCHRGYGGRIVVVANPASLPIDGTWIVGRQRLNIMLDDGDRQRRVACVD
jgi:hypothetical protein